MTMEAASALSSTATLQSVLQMLTAMSLTGPLLPPGATVANNSEFDIIIVGGGTTGCVLASRLSEVTDFNILMIEAGGDPPLESVLGGLFTYLPNSIYSWNYTYSQNDTQYHRNEAIEMPLGHMLGGSSSIEHLLYVRGGPDDYALWSEAAGDDTWGWDGLYPYFLKSEKLVDPEILESSDAVYHGTDGYQKVTREPYNNTKPILDAFEEVGNKIVLDINANSTTGYSQAMYSNAFFRQSPAITYLTAAIGRSNLKVLKNTFVTKLIFDGTTVTGVEAVTDDETYIFSASKEVLVTAGAFNSPQLLMLSGIGPKSHLESFGIDVLADLPVGQNLQDQVCTNIIHLLDESDETAPPTDATKFPAPTTIGLVALNESQSYPDYQVLNFQIPHDSQTLLAICLVVFSYSTELCQAMYDGSAGRNVMFTVHNILRPKARGQVLLQSTDPKDLPLVILGALSEEEDLESAVNCIEDFMAVNKSSYFQKVGAELLDLKLSACDGLEIGTRDYWRCYVKSMIGSMFNYASTCSIGSVVDTKLRVIGMSNLRVCDASAMPASTIGKIKAPVIALAEKAADIIKEDYQVSTK